MVGEGPAQPTPQPKEPKEIPARTARGAEIILRSPANRLIFLAGLVVVVVIAVVVSL